ncbi:TonB-dependent receptor domain-containing protein [Hyunsoonleella pacifica]|nr:TonB-dependent receptor [Hyunsoonleella pacifica]
MKTTIHFILMLLVSIYVGNAQNTISGTIKEPDNRVLEFANVILYNTKTNDVVTGVISNEKGIYLFEDVANGKYYIEVSTLGFKTNKSEVFELQSDKTLDFVLEEETQVLNEVVVKSKRPVIRQTAEKLVVDLEKSEMINSNLEDVIKRVPGLLVTNNGINFAGRSDVRILINGKTTDYMDMRTLLRDLPADNIAKVELIEQPGAEFDAEGSGPIINIILKRNVRLGTHGSVNAWIGEDEGIEHGTSFSIASYKNKLNWQASVGQSSPTWREDLFITRRIEDPNTQELTVYDQATIEPYDPKTLRFGGGLDYYLNDKHSIGFSTRYISTNSERVSRSNTAISSPSFNEMLVSRNTFDRERRTLNINPYYEFKTEGHKLIADFNYVSFTNKNTDEVLAGTGNTVPFVNQRYLQDGKFTINTYKIDYIRTFSDNLKLSFGSKLADVDTDSDLQAFTENNATGVFEFQETNSNRFLINETIFALYTKLNVEFGKWSFSGGVRFEDSNTEGISTNANDSRTRKITRFFPSASISRNINDNLGANIAYSNRIRRPSYNSLNSFIQFYDPLTSEVGNPNLKPSFTNNYQFNLTFDSQPFFTIAYSETKDDLFLFISQDDATAQVNRTTINLSERRNWNFRLFGPLDFIKGIEGFSGFIVDYNEFMSFDLDPQLELSKWNIGWYTQASYKLPWEINAEMSSYFGSGALEGQIDVGWIGDLSFSFGKKFMDDRLKVNLGINKVLNRGFVGTVNYDNIDADIEANGSRQNVQLRVAYSFGSKFGKKKSRRNSSREEQDRIEDNN